MTGASEAPEPGDPESSPLSAQRVRAAYDTVASDYAAAFADDLELLPLDRAMIDAATTASDARRVAVDLGCGPAPVAARVARSGRAVIGLDGSAGMLGAARRRQPGLSLVQADIRRLPFRRHVVGCVIAYYCIQHVPRLELSVVLGQLAEALRPGGVLLVAAHLGQGVVVFDEFLGHRIEPTGGTLYGREELRSQLSGAGFVIEDVHERGALKHEADTRRIYVLARAGADQAASGTSS
ncbi:MAG TPA: class I SAM-dependent methyltransferase [Acidimicrobiales bacterium]|nr:class I SAM-dependent methyltransferase [Acidimicrobiales bacterium]